MSALFTLYPALDLRGGRVVRLAQGRVENEVIYSDDPAATARAWQAQGAHYLHVVDLDRALGQAAPGVGLSETGAPNANALAAILAAVEIPVQLGGGLRNLDAMRRAIGMGVSRLVLGTVAIEQPELVSTALQEFGVDRIVVALDARDGKTVKRGWTAEGGVSVVELGRRMRARGVPRALVTDVARDGMMGGVDAGAMSVFAAETGLAVLASGGVASLDDICALAAAPGVEGVIVGQALYRGAFTLSGALDTLARV